MLVLVVHDDELDRDTGAVATGYKQQRPGTTLCANIRSMRSFSFTVTKHDPDRPWIVTRLPPAKVEDEGVCLLHRDAEELSSAADSAAVRPLSESSGHLADAIRPLDRRDLDARRGGQVNKGQRGTGRHLRRAATTTSDAAVKDKGLRVMPMCPRHAAPMIEAHKAARSARPGATPDGRPSAPDSLSRRTQRASVISPSPTSDGLATSGEFARSLAAEQHEDPLTYPAGDAVA